MSSQHRRERPGQRRRDRWDERRAHLGEFEPGKLRGANRRLLVRLLILVLLIAVTLLAASRLTQFY